MKDARIKIGRTLLGAARLATRYWLLGLVAVAAMDGLFLLLIYLAGRCIGDGYAACIDPQTFALPRHQGNALVGDVVTIVTLTVAFVVSVVMLRLFFLGESIGVEGRFDWNGLRFGPFLARNLVVWIVVAPPAVLLDGAYVHVSWALYPEHAGPMALWLGYLVVRLIGLSLACYLHSRALLYVPAVVFQEQPEGFRAAWARTRRVRWRLFLVVWLIALTIAVSQAIAETLAPVAFDLTPAVDWLSRWSHLGVNYVNALLSRLIIYSILAPLETLWVAALSIIAYRKLVLIDQDRAEVFD